MDVASKVMTLEPIERIRQRNFLWLFENFKEETRKQWPDQPDYGMLKLFAERLGMTQLYVSQIKNGGPKEEGGNGRVIGTKLANNIEKALNLPDGWMDHQDLSKPKAEPTSPTDHLQLVFEMCRRKDADKTMTRLLSLLDELG